MSTDNYIKVKKKHVKLNNCETFPQTAHLMFFFFHVQTLKAFLFFHLQGAYAKRKVFMLDRFERNKAFCLLSLKL